MDRELHSNLKRPEASNFSILVLIYFDGVCEPKSMQSNAINYDTIQCVNKMLDSKDQNGFELPVYRSLYIFYNMVQVII